MKKFNRDVSRRERIGLVGVSALAMILANPAFAQDAAAPKLNQEAADEEAIVVTGSRIQGTDAFNSPDPVTVIDPELSAKEGRFDIASTLQSSPVAAGSTQITSAISSNFVTAGGPGAQTVDLRGLGGYLWLR